MILTCIIITLIVVYFIVQLLSRRMVKEIPVAFAGSYDGSDTVKTISKSRNNTIYTEGDKVVNLDNYTTYIISGNSLERVGIPNGSYVYAQNVNQTNIYDLINRFVIFKYDNKRLAKEHPEVRNPIEGFKARKVVSIFSTKLSEDNFKKEIEAILTEDKEISNIKQCSDSLWRKYNFASDFYNDDNELVVSITYKNNGTRKDYSFHSLSFLKGVVRYKSIT